MMENVMPAIVERMVTEILVGLALLAFVYGVAYLIIWGTSHD